MSDSSPQLSVFQLVTGALGYRSRSDATATPPGFLVSGSQNVLINETTDEEGDKVETRAGYELFGAASTDRNKIVSEFVFKTKVGDVIMGRMDNNGDLEYYSEQSDAWEMLLTGLSTTKPLNWTTVWSNISGAAELLRLLLFVNNSSTLYAWSGATATYASVTATTLVINETISTRGFLANGTRSIRIKDSGGTWRETAYTAQSSSTFTVSTDLTGFTFSANALVVQSVRTHTNTPASGFTNDVIRSLQNHVYVGSASSSIVYVSRSTDYTLFTFSSPRVPNEGAQLVIDDFCIGFETNIAQGGEESLVIFAGDDWIYRVQFQQLGDTTIQETIIVKPIIVSSGQGAVEQGLIAKVKNSIIYINKYDELVELGVFENLTTIAQTPLSDPIKPDFLDANFAGGAIRFWRNNLYVTAPVTGKTFILAFKEDQRGSRRFWQPPQVLPIGKMSDYNGNLIGHSGGVTESYTMFTGTNDNTMPIAFMAHFAYHNYGTREKLKNFDRYFTEMYISSNATVALKLIYEFLGSKTIQEYEFKGSQTTFLFTPSVGASLGVNSLGTSSLGGSPSIPEDFLKYRRFKPTVPVDFFEMQVRYECDNLDGQFQLLTHGANAQVSSNSPTKLIQ